MSLRTLMQAGPVNANQLFARLSETSDGAVKTREKLFSELKAELELHTSLEEQHLFPVLRRNAETKELVTEAIKDNKQLRAKLVELDAQPKNDEVFPERLKELQKLFRQHARDEKRELLPAVQRALSEEQVQNVTEKLEAGVAAAEKARHEEAEVRRVKAREEREEAERQAEQRAGAERAREAAAEQARREAAEQTQAKLRQQREQAERQAEQEAAAKRAQHEIAETAVRTATVAQVSGLRAAEAITNNAQRAGAEMHGMTTAYLNALKTLAPDAQTVAALPRTAISAMTDIRSVWMDWVSQTTQLSQDAWRQGAEQQQRFAAEAVRNWMAHNARVMQITMRVTQEGFRLPFADRSSTRFEDHRSGH